MGDIYLIIKEYDDYLAKRQPWYSVKKLKIDLESKNKKIIVVSSIEKVRKDFSGTVIKVFSLKDLWEDNTGIHRLVYLVTFSIYDYKKFFKIDISTLIANWRGLDRIFLMSITPMFVITKALSKADDVIVISDRSEMFLSRYIKTTKYIPYIGNNWPTTIKKISDVSTIKTIGYFGPPYLTRSFDQVVDFFLWINKKKYNFNKKIITRIDRDNLVKVEEKYTSKIEDKKLKVVSGFLDRDELIKELLEIDVLILPFKIVMAELPIVVLEALELGISVVTTEDSGVASIAKGQKNILILQDFKKNKYNQVIDFINNSRVGNFDIVNARVKRINENALEVLCKK
jgi:glycosyltransferase involved in cell wall biosynthesis